MKSKRVGLAAVGVLLLILVGCLQFDEQTIYLEYDKVADRLLMVINYQGLFAERGLPPFGQRAEGEATFQDVADSEDQLAKAIESKRVAFGGNWPFGFSLVEGRQNLAKPDQTMSDQVRKDLLSFFEHVRVENGGFYEDAAGRCCGAQVLVVDRASEVLAVLNRAINEAMLSDTTEPETADPVERALKPLWLEAAGAGHTWIEIQGNSLVATIPFPEALFQEQREEFAKQSFGAEAGDLQRQVRGLRAVIGNPVWLWHENGMLKVRCGLVTKPSVVVARPRQGDYTPNLAEHIRVRYGLHLDENLARYLLHLDATAETEAETAARTMARRLTQVERIRVLLYQLKTKPSVEFWDKLWEEKRPAPGAGEPVELTNEGLLEYWENWLLKRTKDATGSDGSGNREPAKQG